MIATARDENESYVAGHEGIGNRRDRPALESGVEDRKIEAVFPGRVLTACTHVNPAPQSPVLSENHIRTYWWCSPDKIVGDNAGAFHSC